MPRGPGKASNYNLNYSRFNGAGDDEVTAPEPPDADAASERAADMRELLRNMPPELQEAYRLMMISRESCDKAAEERANELALHAVRRGSPEVQKQFLQELSKKAPEAAQVLGRDLQVDSVDGEPHCPDAVGTKIDALRAEMEEGAKATRRQMEALQKQQEQLERLQSPEDLIKFFKEGGMADEDLQRILTGDQAHMEKCVSGLLDQAGGETKLEQVETQVKAAESLHRTIVKGEAPEDLPDRVGGAKEPPTEPAEAPPAEVRKEPPEPPCLIPDHRLQYHKDENGRYSTVELKCTLPGVKDIGAIALDISEKFLRLSTQVPKYVVNAGPFPVLIEPSAAKARFSKRREELSIVVPAKAER